MASLLALLLLGTTWLPQEMDTARIGFAGIAFDGGWAATGEAFAWLALARAAASERPGVALVLRETGSRWPDAAVLQAIAWGLTWLGGQLVVPGLVCALLFAQLATVIVYEPERNAFSASVHALARAPLQVGGAILAAGLAGMALRICAVSVLFGSEAALEGLIVDQGPAQELVSNLSWYLAAASGQWWLARVWQERAAAKGLAIGAGDARENPWAAG